jgi:hypothetical protein
VCAARSISPARLSLAAGVDRGLAFVAGQQLPSGQIPMYAAASFTGDGEPAPDSTCFGTCLALQCLARFEHPTARIIRERATEFLLSEMEAPGVWRFWTADHPRYLEIPPDADDTVCASHALRCQGLDPSLNREPPANRELLLANRDPRGLFYTWFAPHWSPPPRSVAFWRVAARRWRHPRRARPFFRITQAEPDDVDSVVNANVLLYLGAGPETQPIIDHLIEIVRRHAEEGHDKWYHSRFAFYYALSRCAEAGIQSLGALADEVVERIVAAARPDGSIGENSLHTALAVCAAHNLGRPGPKIDEACSCLLATQEADGGWPTGGLWGVHGTLEWGSRALTSAFCLEALMRCELR